MELLSVRNVTKAFRGLVANHNISFDVREGEIIGLIGPNGAGKSTLFNCIAGVFAPDEGEILFAGMPIQGLEAHEICRRGIARTFQIVHPFGNLTVLENVMVGTFHRHRSVRQSRSKAEEILALLGLDDKRHQRMKDLTFVEQKKVEMARAIGTEPRLLLLDEVMSGLNPSEIRDMVQVIRQVRDQGITILFIEHLMSAVMTLSDWVIVLDHGEKIAEGSPRDVIANPLVVEAYLGSGSDAVGS